MIVKETMFVNPTLLATVSWSNFLTFLNLSLHICKLSLLWGFNETVGFS